MSDISKDEREEGRRFLPVFGSDGLIPAVTCDVKTGDILMVAHMNREALDETFESGYVTYYSRSRKTLWKKGETSGQLQRLVEMRVDCDQDCLVIFAEIGGDGGACHTGRRSCFYRKVDTGGKTLSPL